MWPQCAADRGSGCAGDQPCRAEERTSGAADWDTGLGSNFQILERGHHFIGVAGFAINTGDAVVQVNCGISF